MLDKKQLERLQYDDEKTVKKWEVLAEPSFCPGDDAIPVGTSKFGGFADLPAEWTWGIESIPRLVMQINLQGAYQLGLRNASADSE